MPSSEPEDVAKAERPDVRPVVLVYRSALLPFTNNFIIEQFRALREWRPVLVGLHDVGQMPLDGIDARILRPKQASLLEHIRWKLSSLWGSMPRSVINRLGREGASLLHAHFGPDAITAWPIAKALGLPMIVTLHGYDITIHREWWEAGHGGPAMERYPERLLKLVREPEVRVIAVSDAIRDRAIRFGMPAEKIQVRYIGVDCARFQPGGERLIDRERRVLSVARFVAKKGGEILLRAFVRVQEAFPDACLVLVGIGPLKPYLQQIASNLRIRVEFRGPYSNEQVREELMRARLFCLPSLTDSNGDAEGLPIALLEAQASGVPVVASIHSGIVEAVQDGVTGRLFREGDIDALSAILVDLLTNTALAEAYSRAGPTYMQQVFDIRKTRRQLEASYHEAAAHHRAGVSG
jgi:glycosyltransferase involved in cell wall biosynthesis